MISSPEDRHHVRSRIGRRAWDQPGSILLGAFWIPFTDDSSFFLQIWMMLIYSARVELTMIPGRLERSSGFVLSLMHRAKHSFQWISRTAVEHSQWVVLSIAFGAGPCPYTIFVQVELLC